MKPKIKVIFFDIGGVYVKGHIGHVIRNISILLDLEMNKVENIVKEFSKEVCSGMMEENEYFENVASRLKTDVDTIRKLWLPQEMYSKNSDVEEVILELKKNKYAVGTITDTDPLQLRFHIERGTYGIFDVAFDSVNSKSTKRSKEIYLMALDAVKAKPEESVMIDDTESKLAAAKGLGMHTILFQDIDNLKKDLRKLGVQI